MAAVTPVAGTGINVTNPLPTQQTASANYLDFNTGWAQQYLPELYEAEVERYGNRMLSGFLSQVGAEEAMASDQVVWSEQGRLHLSALSTGADVSDNEIVFGTGDDKNLFRLHDTVVLYCTADSTTAANIGTTIKGIVTTVAGHGGLADSVIIKPFTQGTFAGGGSGETVYTDNSRFQAFVYGSEHLKGTSLDRPALNPGFNRYTNKPIIIRDRFIINGSDTAQIGWVEVSGEEGQSGYMWYLKAEGDTRARFNDYLEMSMIEAVKKDGGSPGVDGTEGLFSAIETRGHVATEAFTGVYTDDIATFDNILVKFDGQGAIEENMLYLDRHTTLKIDDMLGNLNSGVASAASPSSASFGVFNNSNDMAVNLGFTGFRRGSYDFYKTDWKYLNDAQVYGAMTPDTSTGAALHTKIAGAIIPAGVSSVYDEGMGRNIKRPFLHVRYRKSDTEDRKLKSWITGSVGGNVTSDEDAMVVNYLSERCLVVQAANNFMLLKR